MAPNVLERAVDETEIEIVSELEMAFEESAMAHGLTLDYVRSIAVRMFTDEELRYGLGIVI